MQGANLFACVSLSFQPPTAGNTDSGGSEGWHWCETGAQQWGWIRPWAFPATGVSSAHRNAFQSVQRGLGRTWWHGPPGMASQHVAMKEEEFKGNCGLWEFWACHAAQTKSSMCRRQEKPQTNYEPQQHPKWILAVLARTIIHLTGHPSINMAGIYQKFHPSLQDLGTRDEPQACCLCCPEEQRKIHWWNACLLCQTTHHTTEKRKNHSGTGSFSLTLFWSVQ